MKDFEFIEHTADVGMRVHGDSYPALFENAGRGLLRLIGVHVKKPAKERTVKLSAGSVEELLVYWLNELIALVFTYHFLPVSFAINIDSEAKRKTIRARINGCQFTPVAGKIEMEIKAATYHDLKITHSAKGYAAEVILDV